MYSRIFVVALLFTLAGCATYSIDLLPRTEGPMAHGVAKQIDKSVVITIGNETYSGHYAYAQGGSFTLGSATSGLRTATGYATSINAVGNGNVLASAPDGHNLRCVFNFSSWSQQGTGVCVTDDHAFYDLQINRK